MDNKNRDKVRELLQKRIPEIPQKYEQMIKKFFGHEWRSMSQTDIDGALGIAICKAIILCKRPQVSLDEISKEIRIDVPTLSVPYERLAKNGYMKEGKIKKDKDLIEGQQTAWCYIAGTASGLTGNVL